MIFKLWNSTKLSHKHFCNTQHVFHFTLLYEVVVKDLERWQNSSSETSGVLTLSDLTEKKPKFFCSNIFPFLTFLVPILNYMHVAIIWEPERCPTICKQNLTTKSTLVYYYFLWFDKGKCLTFPYRLSKENTVGKSEKQLKTFRMSVSLHKLILCCIWGLFWLTDCFEVFPSSFKRCTFSGSHIVRNKK